MKIALVHDYIKEFGGAERVLAALTEIFPDAPIYTAFVKKNSESYKHFKNKQIITSWVQYFPFFKDRLYSPLRFLTPLIWGSFNFSKYDLVISSASWYITKGFGHHRQSTINHKPVEICYCHTPPRWLYGYSTSVNFQKYWPVRVYALIVGHFLRLYDFKQAQKVNYFIANSKETQSRIKKFYRRDSTVIYPPVSLGGSVAWALRSHFDLDESSNASVPAKLGIRSQATLAKTSSRQIAPRANNLTVFNSPADENSLGATPYYFIVSRIVGAKGLDLAVEAATKAGFKLKIAGSPAGYYFEHDKLIKKAAGKVEFLGQVSDQELAKLYAQAKGFLALSKDEDFGITPVESQACGTAVIAYNGGGYKESVVDGKTGVLFDDYSVEGLLTAIKRFEGIKFNSNDCIENAQKFSKERFKREIKEFVEKYAGATRG